jgi:hypothetical protein
MNPTRALLLKVAKSITAEAALATKDSAKAAAAAVVSATANAASPQIESPGSLTQSTPPPYTLLHHHKDPKLLQYRHPGTFSYLSHHISSSIDAVISLCLSQEARDRFLSLTTAPPEVNSEDDGGLVGSIINTRVLGQSDMGFLKSLTLYEELGDPLLQMNHKFDISEFLDGCGWALVQFHREKDRMDLALRKIIEEDLEARRKDLESGVESESKDIPSMLNTRFLDLIAEYETSGKISTTWLQDMTTPETMIVLRLEWSLPTLAYLMAKIQTVDSMAKLQTVDDVDKFRKYLDTMVTTSVDAKVMNVALLSARVEEVYPPSPSAEQTMLPQKKNDDPDAPLEDGSLTPDHQSKYSEEEESKAQVITQMEVLYELQQSSVNDAAETKTRTSLMVGKFEGCLDGDPNGDELRWKLASYRPAVEFYNI